MIRPVEDHPKRYELVNELHARPFPQVSPPCRVVCLALKKPEGAVDRDRALDLAHLTELLDRHGAAHPAPGQNHYSGRIGRGVLKWEMHTEFVTYTLFTDPPQGDPFQEDLTALLPKDWLGRAPGSVVTSSIVHVEAVPKERQEQALEDGFGNRFVPESLAVSRVAQGGALVAGDFRIDAAGRTRFAVLADPEIDQARLGRIVQRLLEIENYKSMSMLTLPVARDVAGSVARLDRELAECVAGMASHEGQESEALDRLLRISAEIESLSSSSAFRFGAAQAYEAIVGHRTRILGEERAGGWQMFGEFMMRRYDPAMRTCRSARERLDALSARAERAANLLGTRVDVATQAQNGEVLRQMDRRAELQLRLQETVEGLSVVAISYYAVGLAAGLLTPLGKAVGLDKSWLVALLTLPVVLAVWAMIRRIHNRFGGHGKANPVAGRSNDRPGPAS